MTRFLIFLWTIAVMVGVTGLWTYSYTAGQLESAPASWPTGCGIEFSATPTIVFFAHPHCVCTHASMKELSRVLENAASHVKCHIIFTHPVGVSQNWHSTPLYERAHKILKSSVMTDPQGEATNAFRASTSGYTVLYDGDGQLVFEGGITSARGHEGENEGSLSLLSILRGEAPLSRETPVFGCSLQSEGEQP